MPPVSLQRYLSDVLHVFFSLIRCTLKIVSGLQNSTGREEERVLRMESGTAVLGTWDYVVFAMSLLMSSGIGVYYYFRSNDTNAEYLLAGGGMNVWVVSVSLMASFMSAITLLGVPAEIYSFGLMFYYINVSYMIGTPICAFFFLPVFFNLKCTSAYEYLELRFGKLVRTAASTTFMLQMIVYMGIVLYAPALALSAVTGLPKWWSIVSVGLVCTFYCTTGGIRAVLWTDFLQSGLMFAALIIVTMMGVSEVGGWEEVMHRASSGGRLDMGNFDPDPTTRHSFFSLTIGGVFIYCSIYGVNQTQVQRLLTVSSLRKAQVALFMSWPVTSLLSACCVTTGIVMYAYFQGCDPIQEGKVQTADQLLPYFMMRVMGSYPGLPGLFVAGIFSGALSSVSSFVNSLAAVTLEDFVKPLLLQGWGSRISGKRESLVTKLIAASFGLVCLLVAFLAEQMTGILEASLTIFGVVGGPLLGLFTLGMVSKTCSSRSALTAFLLSLAVGFWIGFGSMYAGIRPVRLPVTTDSCPLVSSENSSLVSLPPSPSSLSSLSSSSMADLLPSPHRDGDDHDDETLDHPAFYLYRLSYMYLAGLTFLIEVISGLILSLILWPNRSPLKNNLISPLFAGLFRHPDDHSNDHSDDDEKGDPGDPQSNGSPVIRMQVLHDP